ncbi:MAG: hypothetical protein HBSAPP02_24530 [Phycisphaerae bacterium]|nr:MAG: glycosyl hydrolase [Planctomycetia bacterium]RIK71126.1 MAG: glycosyl hydrolase [Planctomycetota bacterium]GJQ27421.1 MAG: hypothetical protein HBSAPP02_24530 [Phycisphaerae bacterium]
MFAAIPLVFTLAFSASADAPAATTQAATTQPAEKAELTAETAAGLKFRCVGPALSSGRVGDFAVHPDNRSTYYVAVASGGVWKTTNSGTTWKPIFDGEGSYSIGCIALDPSNPNVVWVGTGENNSQRSVSFGDGVYRSRDGGQSWQNMGLKESEHIGRIVVHPKDSNTVWVAAQGPLWSAGGDRGVFKTTDGGATWKRVLFISHDTGANEVHIDPRDPNTLYATAYQRRRHVWTLIDGGPESAVYKSTDGGETWRKINKGLPDVDLGRIGLAVSPANPDIVYAIVEAAEDKSGVFRSTDRGETWEKRSDYIATSPMYYNEIVADPKNVDVVYSLDTFMHRTEDGGKTFRRVPNTDRHVDDHALWIDPNDTNYLLVGCDGGVYESFDRGETWHYKHNLPVTQFYRVAVDHSTPFYYIYGGTQDNNTMGAPSRTFDRAGITNEHWFVTVGGDGFVTRVDTEDPNIVYSLWQYGGLVRHDRKSGQTIDIRPREAPGQPPLRFNWDSPLIISSFDHKRLYFAANILFRSDDQGNAWKAISPDLTRQIDRNKLKVMGRIQPADAVAKHASTSFYGNIVSLCESPRDEKTLYVGTDDGLVQVTQDGGDTWQKIERFPGVPEMSYVSCLLASMHEAGTVYAAFDNHKNGDFKPYLLRSPDRGKNWVNVAGDLPERNIVYSVAEDHENPQMLFTGTEFGVFVTLDGGTKWVKLKGDLPTIAIRDIAVQRRENDLALASFGRGLFILDDYSPLRSCTPETLGKDAHLFPIKPALRYIPSSRLGGLKGRGWMGASYFAAPNPPFGAVFTYYLKEKITSRKERRKEAEKKALKDGKDVPLPTMDELRAEDQEKEPQVFMVIQDRDGKTLRRVPCKRDKGIHRANWDLRYPSARPVSLSGGPDLDPWDVQPAGPLALPGPYTATLVKEVDGTVTTLAGPQTFTVVALDNATFVDPNQPELIAFKRKFSRLQRAVQGASRAASEADTRLQHLRKAIADTPDADPTLLGDVRAMDLRLKGLVTKLRGDSTLGKRNEPTPTSISERVEDAVNSLWYATSPPTQTQRDAYRFAGEEFAPLLADLTKLIETDLPALEAKLEAAGAPWTPGRVPKWEMEE